MTLRGVRINSTATSGYVLRVVAAPDVTLDRVTVVGGYIAIGVHMSARARVLNSTVQNVLYAGILTTGATNGLISGNTIDGVRPANPDPDWNAYGIALTYVSGSGNTTDTVVENNTVRNVPTWHGLDTHAGVRVTFRNNTVSGARRAVFLTASPTAVLVEGNDLTAPTAAQIAACPAGAPPAYCSDVNGISVAGGSGTIRGNVGHGWPSGRWWNPISGGSGYTTPGNSPAIP